MIIGYYGNVRQGKTYSSVLELLSLYLNGYTIYSNTWLGIPYKPLTLDFMLDMVENDTQFEEDKIALFVDEFPVWCDSRVSGSKRNRVVSFFLAQSGKMSSNTDYGVILIFTAQYPDMVDKRLRHFTDKGIECEKYIVNGQKVFLQIVNIFKGSSSYTKTKIVLGSNIIYKLYDTRKKINFISHDRYSKKEINVVVA
jgi:hypothetical protein